MDTQETKLPTYWNTPFNKICLGMKIGQQFKSVVINHQARSLYSLIADGKYRATSLGRNTWKKLIGCRASLQLNCNKEGFNAIYTTNKECQPGLPCSKARIGILGNEYNNCYKPDSRFINSGLAQQGTLMTPTRVATKLYTGEIMATSTSKRWDIF